MSQTHVVIGVDPGGRNTGIVARRKQELLGFEMVQRSGTDKLPGATYLRHVLAAVAELAAMHTDVATGVIAVEGINRPSPHVRVTDPTGLLGTAMTLGAVLGYWPDAVVVPPSHHGDAPLRFYPGELVGPRERAGGGRLRHCRSAWDIAEAGKRLARIARAA